MINYSIVMRSVNANLLEINQAKSRINQAKKDGKEPDKKDTDLVKTEKQNAFAISQYTDVMTIEKFAKHITSHGSVYSRADISAILYMAVDCMRESPLVSPRTRGLNLSGIFRVPEIGMFIKTKVTNFAPLPHSDVKVVQKIKRIFVIS